jgi:hypothetical protein
MPGFLSASGYEGTEEIDLGNGYWVRIKRCISHAEYQRVQDHLGGGKMSVNMDGARFAQMDVGASQVELVAASVTDWNLDDDNGEKWPLTPPVALKASLARLPAPAFMKIYQACDELNGPRKGSDAVSFPDEPVGGDQDGDVRAPGVPEVPDGEGVVGSAGAGGDAAF